MKTLKTPKTLTQEQAEALGFLPLTMPYENTERWMLQNVINDFAGTNVGLCLVKQLEGVELWRGPII